MKCLEIFFFVSFLSQLCHYNSDMSPVGFEPKLYPPKASALTTVLIRTMNQCNNLQVYLGKALRNSQQRHTFLFRIKSNKNTLSALDQGLEEMKYLHAPSPLLFYISIMHCILLQMTIMSGLVEICFIYSYIAIPISLFLCSSISYILYIQQYYYTQKVEFAYKALCIDSKYTLP